MALNSKFAGLQISEQPARMIVMSPWEPEPIVRKDTGEECWIDLHPSQSTIGRAIDRRLLDKTLRRRTQRAGAKDIEQNVIEKLAHLTKAWSLAMPDGTPIDEPCTPENALALYTDVQWLRDQVSNFVNDLGNFRPTPSENSSTSLSMNSDSAA
jgi:hypothetical protein